MMCFQIVTILLAERRNLLGNLLRVRRDLEFCDERHCGFRCCATRIPRIANIVSAHPVIFGVEIPIGLGVITWFVFDRSD